MSSNGPSSLLRQPIFSCRSPPEGGYPRRIPGATVRIRLSSVEGGVEVSVEDEGPGVPEDVVPSLFRKFAQSGNRAGKVGLGLYFCNIMITRWGGKIGYGRPEQPGSQFWFWLPGTGS